MEYLGYKVCCAQQLSGEEEGYIRKQGRWVQWEELHKESVILQQYVRSSTRVTAMGVLHCLARCEE